MRTCLKHLVLVSSILFVAPLRADAQPAACGEVPAAYQAVAFGAALFALETNCVRPLGTDEQAFLAGLGRTLRARCGLPHSLADQAEMLSFLVSSMSVMMAGRSYAEGDLLDSWRGQVTGIAAFDAGSRRAEELDCDGPVAERLADGILAYLRRSAAVPEGQPSFVRGCARHYEGTYSEAQCQCIADVGRAVLPDLHRQAFDRQLIRRIIRRNPLVGLQVAMQCRIGDY